MLMERPEHPQSETEPPHRVAPSWAAATDVVHIPAGGPACRGTGTHYLTIAFGVAPVPPRTFLKEENNKKL